MHNEHRQPSPEEPDANERGRNHRPHILEHTVRQAGRRDQKAHEVPEPPLGARLGQIFSCKG